MAEVGANQLRDHEESQNKSQKILITYTVCRRSVECFEGLAVGYFVMEDFSDVLDLNETK